jgi:hypothetical protein
MLSRFPRGPRAYPQACLHRVGMRREPSPRYGLEDQVSSRDRKFRSATEAGESPIVGMSGLKAVRFPVLNHERAAIERRASRCRGNSPVFWFPCLGHHVLGKDSHVPLAWLM